MTASAEAFELVLEFYVFKCVGKLMKKRIYGLAFCLLPIASPGTAADLPVFKARPAPAPHSGKALDSSDRLSYP